MLSLSLLFFDNTSTAATEEKIPRDILALKRETVSVARENSCYVQTYICTPIKRVIHY